MIPNFPIPDSGTPNSEIRMAYGNPGIPHHEITGPRGGSSGKGILYHWSAGGRRGGVGHRMSNANSGGGHWMSGGGPGRLVLNRK